MWKFHESNSEFLNGFLKLEPDVHIVRPYAAAKILGTHAEHVHMQSTFTSCSIVDTCHTSISVVLDTSLLTLEKMKKAKEVSSTELHICQKESFPTGQRVDLLGLDRQNRLNQRILFWTVLTMTVDTSVMRR